MNEHLIKMIKSNSDKYNNIYILTAFYFLNDGSTNEPNNKNFYHLSSDNHLEKCFDLKIRNSKVIAPK